MRQPHPIRSGALAGMGTTVVFTAVHQLIISDIWFSLLPMLAVGAICGATLGWSYRVLFDEPRPGSWVRYNAAYLAVLVLLGAGSVVMFTPITTITAIMAAGGPPPPELFGRALPYTAVFTLLAVAALALLWARSAARVAALLLTTTVLVFLFGLNISVIGLVAMSGEGYRALVEFFGLTVLILAGNAAFFILIERRGLFAGAPGDVAGAAVARLES